MRHAASRCGAGRRKPAGRSRLRDFGPGVVAGWRRAVYISARV